MKSIKNLKNIKGKTALVRVDFNVPIKNGKVLDDFRIQKAVPTIKFLQEKGANVVLISHLGKDGSESMKPIADRLKKYVKKNVTLLENIRRYPGEQKNDPKLAQELSKLGDFYVNDAFSVSHREHSSVVGIPKYLPSCAGFQLEEEIKNLSKVFKKPKHPFLFILGGAKFSTKMPLIKKYIKIADYIFIGGALLNDFLKAKGYEVGKSLVDDTSYGIEKIIKNSKLIIPEYVVVKNNAGKFVQKNIKDILKDDTILDVADKALVALLPIIQKSKLILWNGPLGKYEVNNCGGTKKVIQLLLKQNKTEIILGGGDLVSCISAKCLKPGACLSNLFVSTGGGATLDFLANGTLPGIKALK